VDATIKRLYYAIKNFVKAADHIVGPDGYYEPPFNESHVWANLWSVVQQGKDMIEEFAEEAQS